MKIVKPILGIFGLIELYDLNQFSRYVSKNKNAATGPEEKFLQQLLQKLEIPSGFFVDIAAGDGFSSSPIYALVKNDWSGFCVEMDRTKFLRLTYLFHKFTKIDLSAQKVTPMNAEFLLKSHEVPKNFEFLNMDIDSFDLEVTTNILKSFSPKIISIEINEKIPPNIYFNTKWSDKLKWDNWHFYGCSISAAVEEIEPFGYELLEIVYNNAFFIKTEKLNRSTLEKVKNLFESGYLNKNDREQLFGYNSEFEPLLKYSPEIQLRELNLAFKKYLGSYEIRETTLK
jgi:hypothetical protein